MLLFLSSPDFFRSEKTRFFPFGKNPTDSKVSTAFSFRFQKKHAQLYTTDRVRRQHSQTNAAVDEEEETEAEAEEDVEKNTMAGQAG
jgi:hypothetical protein